jgi:hypothetical protein
MCESIAGSMTVKSMIQRRRSDRFAVSPANNRTTAKMLLILTSVAVIRERRKTRDVMSFMVVAWPVMFGITKSETVLACGGL